MVTMSHIMEYVGFVSIQQSVPFIYEKMRCGSSFSSSVMAPGIFRGLCVWYSVLYSGTVPYSPTNYGYSFILF